MCYTGYNVEDAILVNEGALQRGLFRTTYFTTYEAHEEKEVKNGVTMEKTFSNSEKIPKIVGTKPGYDYSQLDEYGLIPENTDVDDKTVLIGISSNTPGKDTRKDTSKTPKKGQLGTVDKSFMTDGEEGQRIAKVRLREQRIPAMGDKMASRAGQKGTIGMIIPEENMPFTKDGIRPDLIINPHALPSRMTIGQMVECITGKACALHGAFGDCTAFFNKESKLGMFGELLSKHGYHSSGNEVLYDGMSGKQLESEIFIGPTYYMRLKHMVKDKINYRALGPRTNITRQPVSGRANDGGLRIGEMERDAVVSHGASFFLRESMMERGDKYKVAICNKTGMIAIYNPARNLMLSPMADGPIQYTGSLNGEDVQVVQMSRFGRDFSIVEVPYSLKLFIQELQAMNVRMSIITEDNISQIEKMAFSRNIDKLMHVENATPQMVIEDTRLQLKNSEDKQKKYKRHYKEESTSVENIIDVDSLEKEEERRLLELEMREEQRWMDERTPDSAVSSVPWAPYEEAYVPRPSELPSQNEDSPQFRFEGGRRIPRDIDIESDEIQELMGEKGIRVRLEDSIPQIEDGTQVHYRGDKNTGRLWTIRHRGNRFYTIDTDDVTGLAVEEQVQVVRPEDIYLPGEFVYSSGKSAMGDVLAYGQQQPQAQQAMAYPYGEPAGVSSSGGINFAPVIKIFNEGNDMSQTGGEPIANTLPNLGVPSARGTMFDTPTKRIMGQGVSVVASPLQKDNASSNDNDGGDIDFSKPLIIKKG
jgi:hypothetical protein